MRLRTPVITGLIGCLAASALTVTFAVHGRGTSFDDVSMSGMTMATATPSTALGTSVTATARRSMKATSGRTAATTAAAAGMGTGMVQPPPYGPNLGPGESDTVSPPVKGIAPDPNFHAPSDVSHHEFQANCFTDHDRKDDPIVFPKLSGASHMHTFMGATSTNANSTTTSLSGGKTSCITPADHSGYWFPTVYNGDTPVHYSGREVIYYKSGVTDYRTVQSFPRGLRFVVGSPTATEDEFENSPGAVEGWECGNSAKNWDFPATCPAGTQLNIRVQAPSCWDGVHLDSPDHKSHMSYPVYNQSTYQWVCPPSHPVAVPMIEFKMAFDVSGNMADVHLASGRGYTWHYDFFDAWGAKTLKALVTHCIDGGLQCDPRGFDQYKPDRGAALDENYRLPS